MPSDDDRDKRSTDGPGRGPVASGLEIRARRPLFVRGIFPWPGSKDTPPRLLVDGGEPVVLNWDVTVSLELAPGEHEVVVEDLVTFAPVETVIFVTCGEVERLEYRRGSSWYLPPKIKYLAPH